MKTVYLLSLYLFTFIFGLSYIFIPDLTKVTSFGVFTLTLCSGIASMAESRRIL